MSGNIVGTVDVAEIAFLAFVLFFIALVFWLRREDRREGYPLEDELTGAVETVGGPLHTPRTKSFSLPFGRGTVTAPTQGRDPPRIAALRRENFGGAPYSPTGTPPTDGLFKSSHSAIVRAVPSRSSINIPTVLWSSFMWLSFL